MVASVFDVAAFIREHASDVSAWKLQKLTYYAQAWSLVWTGQPLFGDVIEAWPDGPVVRSLWANEKYGSNVGDSSRLSTDEMLTLQAVLDFYGHRSGEWLVELTHREPPWAEARSGLDEREQSRRVITHDAMRAYYSQIPTTGRSFPKEYQRGVALLVSLPPDEIADLDHDTSMDVDVEKHLQWLETGNGDPWPARSS